MESLTPPNFCKICNEPVEYVTAEGLMCSDCKRYVHVKCLQKGTVPGGLTGDVFFVFTCHTCSLCGTETFVREKMPWFQAVIVTLHHMTLKTPALARKGFFHWKTHIAAFIDKYWDTLFPKEFKRKKKWMGTVSGTLSVYSPHFFVSGTSLFKEQGWWTLAFPRLTPGITLQIHTEFLVAKQKIKERKVFSDDATVLSDILAGKNFPDEYLQPITVIETNIQSNEALTSEESNFACLTKPKQRKTGKKDSRKRLLPTLDNYQDATSKKLFKEFNASNLEKDVFKLEVQPEADSSSSVSLENLSKTDTASGDTPAKLMDPFCHYNTSIRDITKLDTINLKIKLLGGVREEPLYSPYSGLFLKPYIRRDTLVNPPWLKLMAEMMLKANANNPHWCLPHRVSLDYTYVQPEHIPAVNSLCNQFFWPGIDLTECLQYPDFSCIVMYRKLIVGFGFIVPDVKFNESYISFVFTRPNWRKVGIAKFVMYHLIQTCAGKDITLHVSTSNPALLLYQKLGFKVERVVMGFYDKYMRNDTRESKDAFLCRLER